MDEVKYDGVVVKFHEVLKDLIEQSPYNKNRRPICEAIGVSSATLSQYVTGQSRPRYEGLGDIAGFFGVTTDYLLFGKEQPRAARDDSQSMARYVDWALADVQAKVGQRAWLTSRVGQILAESINGAVNQAVSKTAIHGGMLTTDEQLVLEQYVSEIMMLTPHLSYDVIDATEGKATAGRFGHVVADNISRESPRPYSILIPSDLADSVADKVHAFRRLLREDLGVPEDRVKLWEVRVTNERMLVGSCIYRLDVEAIKTYEQMLWLAIEEFVTKDGWLSYSIHDTDEITRGEILVARQHVHRAVDIFNTLWKEADKFDRR